MKRYLATLVLICLITGSFVTSYGSTHVYIQDWDLVDSGKNLHYQNDSKYVSEITYAEETWNNYIDVISEDTALTLCDVTIEDYNWAGTPKAGRTLQTHYIQFNDYYMKNYLSAKRKNVVTHEFGHALGLEHHSYQNNVMYGYVTTWSVLGSLDQGSYTAAYNNY